MVRDVTADTFAAADNSFYDAGVIFNDLGPVSPAAHELII